MDKHATRIQAGTWTPEILPRTAVEVLMPRPSTSGVMMLKKFLQWNVALANKTTPCGLFESRAYRIFDLVVPGYIRRRNVGRIVDIGAGRKWHFDKEIKQECGFTLIGVDDDADELALNVDLDERIVCDAGKELRLEDASVDLVLSRATIEHIADNDCLLAEAYRALRPGGYFAVVFTNKLAPPAILNQMMPNWLAKKMLHALVPNSVGKQGFEARYDLCLHSSYKRALLKHGFTIELEYNSYYASSYWQFFFPLHVCSIALDFVRMMTGSRNLSTQCLFIAGKK